MTESNPVQEPEQKWVSKAAVAAHFGCNIRTIGNLMRRKIIPFVKIRGLLRFDLAECEEAMRKYRARPLWEKDPPTKGSFAAAPLQEMRVPLSPEALPPTPTILDGSVAIAQGVYRDVDQLRQALAGLLPEKTLRGKAGSWILLLIPSEK